MLTHFRLMKNRVMFFLPKSYSLFAYHGGYCKIQYKSIFCTKNGEYSKSDSFTGLLKIIWMHYEQQMEERFRFHYTPLFLLYYISVQYVCACAIFRQYTGLHKSSQIHCMVLDVTARRAFWITIYYTFLREAYYEVRVKLFSEPAKEKKNASITRE